jgi:hypothetical protein
MSTKGKVNGFKNIELIVSEVYRMYCVAYMIAAEYCRSSQLVVEYSLIVVVLNGSKVLVVALSIRRS